MREEPDSLKTPELDREATSDRNESDDRKRMDQVADEAAEKPSGTEKEYERTHRVPATGPGGIS